MKTIYLLIALCTLTFVCYGQSEKNAKHLPVSGNTQQPTTVDQMIAKELGTHIFPLQTTTADDSIRKFLEKYYLQKFPNLSAGNRNTINLIQNALEIIKDNKCNPIFNTDDVTTVYSVTENMKIHRQSIRNDLKNKEYSLRHLRNINSTNTISEEVNALRGASEFVKVYIKYLHAKFICKQLSENDIAQSFPNTNYGKHKLFYDFLSADSSNTKFFEQFALLYHPKVASIYSELASVNAGPVRLRAGAMVSTENADTTAQSEATVQRLISGGGNFILNIDYPLWYINKNKIFYFLGMLNVRTGTDLQQKSGPFNNLAAHISPAIVLNMNLSTKGKEFNLFAEARMGYLAGTNRYHQAIFGQEGNDSTATYNKSPFWYGNLNVGFTFKETYKLSIQLPLFASKAYHDVIMRVPVAFTLSYLPIKK